MTMTPNNTCDSIHLDIEDLTQTQLARMEIPKHIAKHVRSCAGCKSHLDQQLALAEQAEQWTVPAPKRSVGIDVMSQIAQWEHDNSRKTSTFWDDCKRVLRRRIQVPASVAAAIVILLAVSLVINVSQMNPPVRIARHPNGPVNMIPAEHIQTVQTGAQMSVIPAGNELNPLHPWRTQAQLLPSTTVIILGAPPLPWTESLPDTTQNQSQSL